MNSKQEDKLKDFRNFLYVIWKHLNLPDPSEVQYDIANYLQDGPSRRIIQAFRGVGKSWITAAYVVWKLYHNHNLNIEVISATGTEAQNFTKFCLSIIQNVPFLNFLHPTEKQRSAAFQFDVGPATTSKDPSVKSVGIKGQVTGTRADIIIADDIEISTNCLTQSARDTIENNVKEFSAILKPGGDIIYLGTPHTEDSLYNKLVERTGFDIQIWPMLVPTDKERPFYEQRLGPCVARMYDEGLQGESVWPTRFGDKEVTAKQSEGLAHFQMQFMLNPRIADLDRYPLKLRDLIVMDVDSSKAPEKPVWSSDRDLVWGNDVPNVGFTGDRMHKPMKLVGDWRDYEGVVMSIDPAGRGADETGYCIIGQLNGFLYVLDFGGFSDGYSESTLQALSALAAKYAVNKVIVEANFGDGMFSQLLKPVMFKVHKCLIEEVKHSIQKERRICDTLEPVMRQHRLVVDVDAIRKDFDTAERMMNVSPENRKHYQLVFQMTRITRDRGSLKHDDRLDSLAIAVGYWKDIIDQDAEKMMAQRREGEREEWYKEINKMYGIDLHDDLENNNWLERM